jgi:hypothetical protein
LEVRDQRFHDVERRRDDPDPRPALRLALHEPATYLDYLANAADPAGYHIDVPDPESAHLADPQTAPRPDEHQRPVAAVDGGSKAGNLLYG